MKVDTASFEATQGHKPHGYGEWGFKFYRPGKWSRIADVELGTSSVSRAFFTDALEGAKVYAEFVGATRIEVVA
jgi:hypothetical protein